MYDASLANAREGSEVGRMSDLGSRQCSFRSSSVKPLLLALILCCESAKTRLSSLMLEKSCSDGVSKRSVVGYLRSKRPGGIFHAGRWTIESGGPIKRCNE